MKTYLITGGAGFIGANLVRKILATTSNPSIHVIEPVGSKVPICYPARHLDMRDSIAKVGFVHSGRYGFE
jgi:nucleoside-diphosphate-sugar epimerase